MWTNVFKLPEPFAHLISEDLYHEERKKQLAQYCQANGLNPEAVLHYSASDLIKPPRMRCLLRRYADKIVEDVSTHIYRILGTAIHTALKLSAQRMEEKGIKGYIPEERIFTHFQMDGRTIVISGEPDLITPDGWIHDYKVTAVYGLKHGVKSEWEQATNIYVWLRGLQGFPTKGILITFILRDWSKREARIMHDYPQAAGQTMECRLWTTEQQLAFIKERTKLHMENEQVFDDELPECSAVEMWEKPAAWAVIREDSARAVKVYRMDNFPPETMGDTLHLAASADAELRNKKLKKGEKPYLVEHRLGERTRCQDYCSAKQFCSQYKEFASAAFQSAPKDGLEGAHHEA